MSTNAWILLLIVVSLASVGVGVIGMAIVTICRKPPIYAPTRDDE